MGFIQSDNINFKTKATLDQKIISVEDPGVLTKVY